MFQAFVLLFISLQTVSYVAFLLWKWLHTWWVVVPAPSRLSRVLFLQCHLATHWLYEHSKGHITSLLILMCSDDPIGRQSMHDGKLP
jgi:hypothetical protein